jgi:transcriptional regulator with XRE-family HTH domain
MNRDYAHVLARPQAIDWLSFGRALQGEIRRRGLTLDQIAGEVRLSRATISRASTGHEIGPVALLKLCVWCDLNPFELLRPDDRSPAEYARAAVERRCFT